MRRFLRLVALLAVAALLLVAVAPVAATESTTTKHKNYKTAEGSTSGANDDVVVGYFNVRAFDNQSFVTPAEGPPRRGVRAFSSFSVEWLPSGITCSYSGSIVDPDFQWSAGRASLRFESNCGPVEVIWRGKGAPTVTQHNGVTPSGGHVHWTEWVRNAVMSVTIDGIALPDGSGELVHFASASTS